MHASERQHIATVMQVAAARHEQVIRDAWHRCVQGRLREHQMEAFLHLGADRLPPQA